MSELIQSVSRRHFLQTGAAIAGYSPVDSGYPGGDSVRTKVEGLRRDKDVFNVLGLAGTTCATNAWRQTLTDAVREDAMFGGQL